MTSAEQLIQSIDEHIINGNIQSIGQELSFLPLDAIPSDKADILIAHFLKGAINNKDIVRLIIETFDLMRIQIDPLPAITKLFLNDSLERNTLITILKFFPEKLPINYYFDLMNMHDDVAALKAAGVIDILFPNITITDWKLLLEQTISEDDDDEHPLLREFFKAKTIEVGAPVSCPPWVQNFPKINIQPFKLNIPSVEDAANIIINHMSKSMNAIDNEDNESIDIQSSDLIRTNIINQYAISTISEKIKMLKDFIPLSEFDCSSYFREFGPVNTMHSIKSEDHDITHPCGKFGGCRMFTCTEFEDDDGNLDIMAIEEHTMFIDWWRKYCDQCHHRILKKHYSVRLPLLGGGWKGCFCSFDCMKQNSNDTTTNVMIGRIMEQLETIGIRERT